MFESWRRELQVLPVDGLDRRGLCDAAAGSSRLRAALDAFDARIAAAVDRLDDNGPGPSTVIRGASKCSQREADKRVRRAEALEKLPSAADALAEGTITAEHVDTLARAAVATSPEEVEQSDLLTRAQSRPADLHANDTREWTRRHQTQADLEAQQRRHVDARRCVIFSADNGMTVLHAELDPITGAHIRSVLDTACDRLYHADGGRDATDSRRTPQQRRADALTELLTGGASGDRARSGPVRTQMLVIAHADGTAEIPGTGPIPATELAKLACSADLYGLVLDTNGQPLWHGTRVRLADDNQWRALIARDKGCVICGAHPSRCEAHHVDFYGPPINGPTDVDNLALLCRHEHHLVHDQGHELRRRCDGSWELRPPDQARAGP
ncbi:MAG: DUF222 domain-containing protein [Acidimicrobiales bacterium]